MKDLSTTEKQIEVFCAFIIDFNNINATVSKMMASDNETEKQRALKIHKILSTFIVNTTSADDLLANLNLEISDPRINKLLNYAKKKLNTNKEATYKSVLYHYSKLNKSVNPKISQKKIVIEEIDNESTINADPFVPISNQDLNFLNKIAKLSISNTVEIREANKNFKSLNFKNKVDELYSAKAYYFEQVFANTDVQIQRKLLNIIKERHLIHKPKTEEIEAYNSLVDINTLSDIDTLALKTSSNVSDHQAFEAFSKILKRNSNPNIIKKVLKENIIMTAMFKTNATSISPYYGIKKLFISAIYPYNEVIIKRYMQLMEKDEFELSEIIVELSKDPVFKQTYDVYQKGQETKLFLKFAEDIIAELYLNNVNETLINKVLQVIKGFSNRGDYSFTIFPQDIMFRMLDDIYYYVVTNELFNQVDLKLALDNYLYIRVSAALLSESNPYSVTSNTIVYGITASDLWLAFHKMIYTYNINWINKYYLKYNEIDILTFTPNNLLQPISEKVDGSDLKHLPNNESLIICAKSGSQNFDMYLYDIFTRISKGIFYNRINITIKRTEGSIFRKKEYLGLIKTDEVKIRKFFTDYITFETLANIDTRYFVNVYKRKITTVLKNLLSIESSYEEITQFVDAKELTTILGIFKSRDSLEKLLKKAIRYENSDEESLLIKHSSDFFDLTSNAKH